MSDYSINAKSKWACVPFSDTDFQVLTAMSQDQTVGKTWSPLLCFLVHEKPPFMFLFPFLSCSHLVSHSCFSSCLNVHASRCTSCLQQWVKTAKNCTGTGKGMFCGNHGNQNNLHHCRRLFFEYCSYSAVSTFGQGCVWFLQWGISFPFSATYTAYSSLYCFSYNILLTAYAA